MKNQARTRRIPSYVTTREEHVEMQHESSNRWTMGLLIATAVLAFISTVFSVANLLASKRD